jgi:hypothetical protein
VFIEEEEKNSSYLKERKFISWRQNIPFVVVSLLFTSFGLLDDICKCSCTLSSTTKVNIYTAQTIINS